MNKVTYFVDVKAETTTGSKVFKMLGRSDPDAIILAGASENLVTELKAKFSPKVEITGVPVGSAIPTGAKRILNY